jgi:hypothetical protein
MNKFLLSSRFWAVIFVAAVSTGCLLKKGPYAFWPSSSQRPVVTYENPSIEERSAELQISPNNGYRFSVFGDQRALVDDEWQQIMARIVETSDRDPLLFMIDTGDFLQSGSHTDQFWWVLSILHIARELPYLVSIGNHETDYNLSYEARQNTATFLSYLDDELSADRFYYSREVGPVRFIFLDTNDFVYGDDGRGRGNAQVLPGSRGESQLQWVVEQLESDDRGADATTIAVIHHPFLQSSQKHREQALKVWHLEYMGRTLPNILLDGGVDVVLTGHVHTYERFRMSRADGKAMHVINVSGRPRNNRYWKGKGARRAKDIGGKERSRFAEWGWEGLTGWEIVQEDVMVGDGFNQFGVVTVEPDGGLLLDMYFVDREDPDNMRHAPAVRLK